LYAYFDSGAATTPSPTLASISVQGLPLTEQASSAPTYIAACDQVDCVRYLMAVETFSLPSTSTTSAG
jgi:hypothetical protein